MSTAPRRLYLVSAFSGSLLVSRSFESHAEATRVADEWERAGYVVELRHPRPVTYTERDAQELSLPFTGKVRA